jgi:hypothetical protein
MRMPGTRQSRRLGVYAAGLVLMAAVGMSLPLPPAAAGNTGAPGHTDTVLDPGTLTVVNASLLADPCTPEHLSGCTGTDAPTDGTPLTYCGPDGTCTPVTDSRTTTANTPRHGGHRAHR